MTRPRLRIGGDALATVAAVLALVALAVWRQHLDAPRTDTYSSTDFRSGGYAAWYELLAREGTRVERFERRTPELDGATDTLVDAAPVEPLAERGAAEDAALLAWVRAGGRLIRIGRSPSEPPELAPPNSVDTDDAGPLRGTLAPLVSTIAEAGRARFRGTKNHPLRGALLLYDRGGALVLRRALGRGEVVFVSTPQALSNGAIAQRGNARFAYLLARPRSPSGIVAFDEAIHGTVVDRAWWQTLAVPLRVGLGGVAVAIVLAVIGGALRLGPAVRTTPAREPASDEFITAIAVLYERSHARAHVLAVLAAGSDDPELQTLAANERPTDRNLIDGAARARTLRAERT